MCFFIFILLYVYVSPEELSAPDSYSLFGAPTSYSGVKNTEELSTPEKLSPIAIRGC
jgi:hypothetical protein